MTHPPIFDFERWFKDTYGPLVREGQEHLVGYNASYDTIYNHMKRDGWMIYSNGNVSVAGHTVRADKARPYIGTVTATQARPYMGKYDSNRQGEAWTLEERGEFMTNFAKWVKSQSGTHGRSEGAIIYAIKRILQ
jgi:hypothetical protein